MVKTLFAHDHKFQQNETGVFSSGGLPASVWLRYLNFSEKLTVIGRLDATPSAISGVLSSRNNVSFHLVKSPYFGVANIKAIFELVRLSDIVVIRVPSLLGIVVYLFARILKKNIFVEVVDCVWDGMIAHGSVKRKLFAPFYFLATRLLVKNASQLIYVTNKFLQNRYPHKHSAKVCSISNVELKSSDFASKNSKLQRLKDQPHSVTIGTMGTLNGRLKGIDLCFMVFQILKPDFPNLKLSIAGAGDQTYWKNFLEQVGIDNCDIQFVGNISERSDVLDWFDNLCVYLHLSRKEGLSRVILEAMARKRPVVASNAGGTGEIVQDDFVFKHDEIVAIANAVKSLIIDSQKRKNVSDENYKTALRFENTILEQRRNQFFRECLNGS